MIKQFFVPQKKNKFEPYVIRPIALLFYTIFLVSVNLYLVPRDKVVASSITSQSLIELTNEERLKYGLNELSADINLTSAAYAKANDILTNQYWDHYGPSGQTPWSFMISAGYNYYYAGENLAKGFSSSEGVHQALMNSPTHRENILGTNYQDIGIAVVEGDLLGEKVNLVVQMFGSKNGDNNVPTNSTEVKGESNIDSSSIKSIKITYPNELDYISTNKIKVTGEASPVDVNSKGAISLDQEVLGEFDINNGSWVYEIGKTLTQGEHAIVGSADLARDSRTFFIDTLSPILFVDKMTYEQNVLDIYLSANEPDLVVQAVIGSDIKSAALNEFALYEVSIENYNNENVKIIAKDKAGNVQEVDLSEQIEKLVKKNAQGDDFNIRSLISSIDLSSRDMFNGGFILFVMIIIIIELILLYRQRLLASKGYLVTMLFVWSVVIVLSYIIGLDGSLGGSINV